MSGNYTLEQLTAASNLALAEIAASVVMGWQIGFGSWEFAPGEFIRCHLYEDTDGAVMPVEEWRPATDRNQSYRLLTWAVENGADFMIRLSKDRPRTVFFGESLLTVPGNDARAETIAAILAVQAA